MDWMEITIKTSHEGIEPVAGMMLMAGMSGWLINDPRDIQHYLEGPQAARWDYVDEDLLRNPDRETEMRVYVGDNAQGQAQWETLRDGLVAMKGDDGAGLYGSLDWHVRMVKDEDWANNWKAYFKPFSVGSRLIVKPTWEPLAQTEGRAVLEIDPGSSFGTGQHHTTKMCMKLMEKYVRKDDVILDIGCGSGILMIAGLLLGAAFAAGVDVEEHSVVTAEENIRQNGIKQDRYALYCGDLTDDERLRTILAKADLLVINIVADVIIGMAPYYADMLAEEGKLLVSGVIDDRRGDVVDRLAREGFTLIEEMASGEWNAFVFDR